MKCVVTGGSGFIGSHLVDVLLKHGHEVGVLDTRPPVQDVEWIEKDIRSSLAGCLAGVEAVFHLAAIANARKCGEHPVDCCSINVVGTANLLEACARDGVGRFVLASSAWVAGAQMGEVVSEESPMELHRVNTTYGATKIAQETLCTSFLQELGGPDYTILRYGTPYGERMWKGLVVRAFMQMAEESGVITVLGDGKQTREFLYVGDLCEAHVHVLDSASANRVYNVTGDRPTSVEQIASEIVKHFPSEIDYVPQARVEPKLNRVLNDRAKRELNWSPVTSLEEGIERCARWWQGLTQREKREAYWY